MYEKSYGQRRKWKKKFLLDFVESSRRALYTLETTENEKFHEKVRDLHAFDEV